MRVPRLLLSVLLLLCSAAYAAPVDLPEDLDPFAAFEDDHHHAAVVAAASRPRPKEKLPIVELPSHVDVFAEDAVAAAADAAADEAASAPPAAAIASAPVDATEANAPQEAARRPAVQRETVAEPDGSGQPGVPETKPRPEAPRPSPSPQSPPDRSSSAQKTAAGGTATSPPAATEQAAAETPPWQSPLAIAGAIIMVLMLAVVTSHWRAAQHDMDQSTLAAQRAVTEEQRAELAGAVGAVEFWASTLRNKHAEILLESDAADGAGQRVTQALAGAVSQCRAMCGGAEAGDGKQKSGLSLSSAQATTAHDCVRSLLEALAAVQVKLQARRSDVAGQEGNAAAAEGAVRDAVQAILTWWRSVLTSTGAAATDRPKEGEEEEEEEEASAAAAAVARGRLLCALGGSLPSDGESADAKALASLTRLVDKKTRAAQRIAADVAAVKAAAAHFLDRARALKVKGEKSNDGDLNADVEDDDDDDDDLEDETEAEHRLKHALAAAKAHASAGRDNKSAAADGTYVHVPGIKAAQQALWSLDDARRKVAFRRAEEKRKRTRKLRRMSSSQSMLALTAGATGGGAGGAGVAMLEDASKQRSRHGGVVVEDHFAAAADDDLDVDVDVDLSQDVSLTSMTTTTTSLRKVKSMPTGRPPIDAIAVAMTTSFPGMNKRDAASLSCQHLLASAREEQSQAREDWRRAEDRKAAAEIAHEKRKEQRRLQREVLAKADREHAALLQHQARLAEAENARARAALEEGKRQHEERMVAARDAAKNAAARREAAAAAQGRAARARATWRLCVALCRLDVAIAVLVAAALVWDALGLGQILDPTLGLSLHCGGASVRTSATAPPPSRSATFLSAFGFSSLQADIRGGAAAAAACGLHLAKLVGGGGVLLLLTSVAPARYALPAFCAAAFYLSARSELDAIRGRLAWLLAPLLLNAVFLAVLRLPSSARVSGKATATGRVGLARVFAVCHAAWPVVSIVSAVGAGVAIGGASTPSWHPGIPTGWSEAPGSVAAFKNGTADPWRYSDRLGLYKVLIASTPQLYFNSSSFTNPLWGLPLQFSWQHDTGRLLDDSAGQGRVNGSSWWGNMNYFLSIVPFVAAVDAGVVAPGLVLAAAPEGAAIGCTTFAECAKVAPNATALWRQFFVAAASGGLNASGAVESLWRGHIASLHEGIPIAQPTLQLLPSSSESEFGLSWANLVDFVAALQFDVDFNNTNYLQGLVVPPRILTDADKAPHIPDFSPAENRALLASKMLYAANNDADGIPLALFRRLCCTPAGRDAAFTALVGFLQNPVRDIVPFLRMLGDLVVSHPC